MLLSPRAACTPASLPAAACTARAAACSLATCSSAPPLLSHCNHASHAQAHTAACSPAAPSLASRSRACAAACRVLKPSMPLMLHADVDGSLEALTSSLLAVNTGRIVFKVVGAGVGPPSSRDVQLAADTGACLVCFGVSAPASVAREADSKGVSVVQSECALTPVLPCAPPRMPPRVLCNVLARSCAPAGSPRALSARLTLQPVQHHLQAAGHAVHAARGERAHRGGAHCQRAAGDPGSVQRICEEGAVCVRKGQSCRLQSALVLLCSKPARAWAPLPQIVATLWPVSRRAVMDAPCSHRDPTLAHMHAGICGSRVVCYAGLVWRIVAVRAMIAAGELVRQCRLWMEGSGGMR
jgi:Translation-initiation factor 2